MAMAHRDDRAWPSAHGYEIGFIAIGCNEGKAPDGLSE
jgi:hypothetical protein